jgi:hypothetical protein
MNLELIKAKLLPVNIKFTDRSKYYDCFDHYSNGRSPEALSQLIADYEIKELKNRLKILAQKESIREKRLAGHRQ